LEVNNRLIKWTTPHFKKNYPNIRSLEGPITINSDGIRRSIPDDLFISFHKNKLAILWLIFIYVCMLQKEVKKIADRTPVVQSPMKKDITAASGMGFWEIVTGAPRGGLSSAEWAKFITAMKQV